MRRTDNVERSPAAVPLNDAETSEELSEEEPGSVCQRGPAAHRFGSVNLCDGA